MNPAYALAHRLPSLAALAVAGVLSVAVGGEIAAGRWQLALALAVLVAVPAVATVVPAVALAALVGGLFTAFVDLPPLGVASLNLGDALLAAGVIASLGSRSWPPAVRTLRSERMFTTGLALLAVGGMVGAAVGIFNGANAGGVVGDARPLLFLAALVVVLTLVVAEGFRPLLVIGGLVTVAAAGLVLAQALAGGADVLFVADHPYDELLTCPLGPCAPDVLARSFLRIRSPGLLIAFVAVIFAVSYLLWSPRRRTALALVLAASGGFVVSLSLNRNMLISTAVGLLASAIAIPGRHRPAAVAAAVAVAALALLSSGSNPVGGSTVASRFASAVSLSHTEQDESLRDRERENTVALRRLRQQPLVGLGWGVPYDPASDAAKPKLWLHNQYLELLLKIGPLGLLGWLLCVFACIRRSVVSAARLDPSRRWLAAGTAAALIALSMSSLVGLYLLDVRGMVVFAALFAVALALGTEARRAEARTVGAGV